MDDLSNEKRTNHHKYLRPIFIKFDFYYWQSKYFDIHPLVYLYKTFQVKTIANDNQPLQSHNESGLYGIDRVVKQLKMCFA